MSGWVKPETIVGHGWQYRAYTAAAWIPQNSIVLDLGCGDMALEKELPSGCTYIPSDIVARDERTIVCNLNKQHLPELKVTHVTVLGVLEHLIYYNHRFFVGELEKLACPIIISYHFDRWDERWQRRLTRGEFADLFKHYVVTRRASLPFPRGQELMYLTPKK
jgi:hypothetical protein